MRRRILASHKFTARDYVQDGLVGLYDGIENAGWGIHENSLSVWKNLVNSPEAPTVFPYDIELTNAVVAIDHIYFNGVDAQGIAPKVSFASDQPFVSGMTLESVFEKTGSTSASASVGWSAARGSAWRPSITIGNSSVSVIGNNNGLAEIANENKKVSVTGIFSNGSRGVAALNGSVYYDGQNLAVNWGATTNRFRVGAYGSGSGDATGSYREQNQFCIRIYNRSLSYEEIAWNYAVDKARFGLT